MNPSINAPVSGPENLPPVAPRPERSDGAVSPEVAHPERKVEKEPGTAEQMQASQGMSLPAVQPMAQPITSQPIPVAHPPKDHSQDTPLIADDVDVIEMEWVNQAKKVIRETKDDPHAQEIAVEKLQKDYLRKRFGREIKPST